ncbi:MAG TPA: hypothetical protein VGK40_11340, partial [Verrucomicrobiae bacterium]
MSRGFALSLICLTAGWLSVACAAAESYSLRNGRALVGDPASYTAAGLIVKRSDGTFELRVPWSDFDQPTIKKLMNDPQATFFVEPYLEPEPVVKVKPPPLVLKSVSRLERPAKGAALGQLFSSPVSWAILLILYLANLYAAYEIAIYRNQHASVVCGLAAVLPIIGPIIFLSTPSPVTAAEEAHHDATVDPAHDHAAHGAAPSPQSHAAPAAESGPAGGLSLAQLQAPAATIPGTVSYLRGQYTFNRRFFETKMPGFFRVVPSEADKEMVLVVKFARGEVVANRIARISADEMHLQIMKGSAS